VSFGHHLAGVLTVPGLASLKKSHTEVGVAPRETTKDVDPRWQEKLEKGLMEAVETGKRPVNVLIYFSKKPDLSKAKSLPWRERGRFVYQRLKETTTQSQANALKKLRAAKGAYKSHQQFFRPTSFDYRM